MIACLFWVGHYSEIGTLGAFLATIVLVISVGLSLVLGVAASYGIVRLVLGAFGSRTMAAPMVEQARAAAAGD